METYEEILSDIEKAKIIAFNSDPIMREAIKKTILFGVYNNGVLKPGEAADPTKNFALRQVFKSFVTGVNVSNEALGENIRSSAIAIQLLEGAFDELSKITADKPEEDEEVNAGE